MIASLPHAQASALADEAESFTRAVLPAELVQKLDKMQAAGGAAPAPAGTVTAEALADQALAQATQR